MNDTAELFGKRMRTLQESLADHFGFYRIRPDEAGIILARLHGFKWSDSEIIIIPSKYFDGYSFWTEKVKLSSLQDAKIEALKKTYILNTKFSPINNNTANFYYQARMHPLSQFSSLPTHAKEIVDKVEKFCLIGDKPFFDYLWVLVPSISLDHPLIRQDKNVDKWTLIDENGSQVVFEKEEKAANFLDIKLTEKNLVCPIIIGERDGKSYFLSMWR